MIATPAEILTFLRQTTTITSPDLGLVNMLQPMVEQAMKSFVEHDIERATHVEFLPLGKDYVQDSTLEDFDLTATGAAPRARTQGTVRLQLKHLPVVLDDTLEVREQFDAKAGQTPGAFSDATILVRGQSYWLDIQEVLGTEQISKTGHLIRTSVWPREPGSIKVTYTAGWTPTQLATVASELKLATLLTMAKAYKQAAALKGSGAGGLISESIGKYSYTRDASTAASLTGMVITLPDEAKAYAARFKNLGRYR